MPRQPVSRRTIVRPSQTVTAPSADLLAIGARGRLEIEFSGESWVGIRDALGRIMLADLMTPDKGVDLETYGPVSIDRCGKR